MFWLMIIGIILLGLLFIIGDILFIPGGVVGIIGGIVIIYGVYLSYTHSVLAGNITLLITIISIILGLVLAMRSKTWKKVQLDTAISSKTDVNIDAVIEKGDFGKAVSRLMPMGKAKINDQLVEVSSIEGPINQGDEIEVVKIDGAKIYVKQKL